MLYIWLYGCMVVWLYGCMVVLLNCYIVKLLLFNGTLKLNYLTIEILTIYQFSLTVQQFSSSALYPYNHTAILFQVQMNKKLTQK
jgi:hypothetical protein